jgi:(2R)-sulfolactate sulfo-lyase subunit alpha
LRRSALDEHLPGSLHAAIFLPRPTVYDAPCAATVGSAAKQAGASTMIHFVLHDANDTVAVVVVEGIKAGTALDGWIMDEDKTTSVKALQDIPIGHKVALRDMAVGDTVVKYGINMGKVVAPIKAGEHAHVHNIKTKRW